MSIPSASSLPFDRIVSRYRLINRIISLGLDHSWRKALLKAAEISPKMTVLDLGCGTGELLDYIPKGGIRIGLDPEDRMLRSAQGSFARLRGTGESLPLKLNSVDRVISAFVLRNLKDREETFLQLYGVLKVGCKGVLVDFSPPSINRWWNPKVIYLKIGIPLIGGLLSGDRAAYNYLSQTVLAFPQPGQIALELTDIGFINVQFRQLVGGVAILYTFEKSLV